MTNHPVKANAAGKQPADIAVKCTSISVLPTQTTDTKPYPKCTIVVTYNDWSTDVAYLSYKPGNSWNSVDKVLTGNTSQIVSEGGYKAVTDCPIPDRKDPATCVTFGLKSKPATLPNTNTATVMQMPTTGAPEGLSTVGLVAVGLGMLAVGVGLAKSERF